MARWDSSRIAESAASCESLSEVEARNDQPCNSERTSLGPCSVRQTEETAKYSGFAFPAETPDFVDRIPDTL